MTPRFDFLVHPVTWLLFFTFAELVILVCLRWLVGFLETAHRRQAPFVLACGSLFLLSVWLSAYGGDIVGPWLEPYGGVPRWWYGFLLRHFFYTLWASLEGVFTCYVFRIQQLVLAGDATRQAARGRWRVRGPTMAGLVLAIFALYVFYHARLVALWQQQDGIPLSRFVNATMFYERICGVFWITFEWAMALMVFRVFLHLRQAGGVDADRG